MYSNELDHEDMQRVAQSYVGWLYHFNQRQVDRKQVDALGVNAMCSMLLDYTPSVHRDDQSNYYYRQVCLKCGTVCFTGRSIIPSTSECHACVADNKPYQLELETCATALANPFTQYFEVLPCAVQDIVFNILLDPETHPKYNKSIDGDVP